MISCKFLDETVGLNERDKKKLLLSNSSLYPIYENDEILGIKDEEKKEESES